ncbi:LINE-1 reverse transcriptase-like [Symbiodinium microadriaticum]|uniref:LINE-1 reverse transcriptase-like n=1 Tax=Symbiodinium microadriaticum TaxID=2951 RepID=A0A1Q9DL50_SYMMI|nr:LINE-1 reverse transcriptase-like [Symbiodinium microadriaticum]
MLQQIWCGLCTTPQHNGASPEYEAKLDNDLHGAARAVRLLGGAGSARSQVRAGADRCSRFFHSEPLGVRVGVVPRNPPGATSDSASGVAKRTGDNASLTVEALCAHRADRIKKRSLRRAIRRAQSQGTAAYRGRRLVATVPRLPVAPDERPKQHAERFEIFSWNCGGLSQLLLEEIKLMLKMHSGIKIMVLVETHHSYTNEWVDGDWTFVHSPAASPKQGGILLGIRRDFCTKETMRWQELIPGRLLHLRCFAKDLQHLDVIAVYQHALPFGAEALNASLVKRKAMWGKLDKLLGSLPVRSSVVLAGDFNSGLNTTADFAGFGIVPHSQQTAVAAERQELTTMLHSHRLCALNTWGRKEPTYKHPSGRSQIDFILVRRILADGAAKRCAVWRTPLAGWRSSGHASLKASIRLHWKPWSLRGHRASPTALGGSSTPAGVALQALRNDLGQVPAVPAARVARPALVGLNGELLQYWQAQRQLRSQSSRTFHDIFARMRLFLQLRRRHRELKARARFQKRRQLLDILERAEGAAAKGDSKSLFQCVRLLAPRGGVRSLRLRDAQGNLMHPSAECRLLSQYAAELFKARREHDICCPELLPLSPDLFTPAAWESALRSLRGGKAVPAGQPAIEVWKREISTAAQALSQISLDSLCGDKPYLPAEWCDMQFAWLPKAGKTPSSPENLRSIGLMAADTKGMLVILREAVKPFVVRYMFEAPQYAYRPGASTADALLRASFHCSSVRALLCKHQQDHTSKILGTGNVDFVGGMMISVDLRKAFDSVSHGELYKSMLEASIPPDLASALIQIHVQTRCSVLHGGACEHNAMSRGLRQGCPVAPILFAAWSVRTLRLSREALPRGADRDCYTMFADDLHGSWEFHSAADFLSSLRDVRAVFSVLEGLGMAINFQKSVAVLRLRGAAVARVSRHVLVWRPDGQYLRVRSDPHDFYIPVASTMSYLGATLSYDNYELKTFQNRAHCAQLRFQELRKVLRSNGALSARHRLRLYRATVWPSLWYSLGSIGVTGGVLRGVISVLSGHLRKVLRIYEGGITNQAVIDRAGLCPQRFFAEQAALKAASIAADPFRSADLKQRELKRADALCSAMASATEVPLSSCSLVRVSTSEAACIPCRVCGIYFHSEEGLQMHIAHQHAEINQSSKLDFNKALHSLFGLPFCRFCRQRLHDWNSLAKHVSMGMCLRIKSLVAEGKRESEMLQILGEEERRNPPTPPDGAVEQVAIHESVGRALTITPDQLGSRGAELRVLSRHCALCYQLVKDPSKIKKHWQDSHAQEWRAVAKEAVSEARSLLATFTTPCSFCGIRITVSNAPRCFSFLLVECWLGVDGRVQESGGKAAAASPPSSRLKARSVDSYTSLARLGGSDASVSSVVSADVDWVGRVVLTNPGNLCYLNAAVLSILHCSNFVLSEHRGIQTLRRIGAQGMSAARGVLLTAQLQVRSMLRSWSFDGRQHDVAEFATVLLRGLGLGSVAWEARRQEDDAIRTLHSGPLPLLLPPPDQECMLQDCVQAWHLRDCVHALCAQPPPALLLLQVARHQDGYKSFVPVWPDSEIRIPVFGNGLAVEWTCYKIQAIVEHHGEEVSSGHYRAVLSGHSDWLHTDDGIAASGSSTGRNGCWSAAVLCGSVSLIAMTTEEAPDASMLDGEQEWDFYTKYWPSGPGMPAPPSSDTSTADQSAGIEEREAKTAKLLEAKGGQGRGSGDGKGSAGPGGQEQAAPKSAPGAHKRQQRDAPAQWRGGGGNGGGGGGNGGRTGYGSGGGGRSSWGSSWRGDERTAEGDEWSLRKEVQDLKYAVSLMQRLILRHEDASILARIESSFVLHFKLNVPASVVPMLFTSAVAWRKIKAEEPQRLDRPMRCALLVCLFAELKERMTKIVQEPERLEEMAKLGWLAIGPPVVWNFMRWDAAKQQQVVDTSHPPLSQAEILEFVGRLVALIPRKFTTARFHPTRPMTQVMTGLNLVFLLQTGQHGEASSEMRDILRRLCYCSVMHLLAAQLKEDKHARSALANAIADYLTKYSGNR